MSDENTQDQDYVAPASAPDSGATAAPDDAENPTQGGEEQPQEPRTFTQEEVDRIAQKEREKAERRVRREMEQRALEAQRPANQPAPTRDQFATEDQFVEALSDYKADVKVAEREQQQRQTQVISSYADREETVREKYSDFDKVAYTHPSEGGPAITPLMADAIRESELGPEIAYYLGKNVAESHRIYGLSPLAQAREIGKIEAKLGVTPNTPPAVKVSSAPDPITPIGGGRANPTKYDVTDPRSDKAYSDSEWIRQRNKQSVR